MKNKANQLLEKYPDLQYLDNFGNKIYQSKLANSKVNQVEFTISQFNQYGINNNTYYAYLYLFESIDNFIFKIESCPNVVPLMTSVLHLNEKAMSKVYFYNFENILKEYNFSSLISGKIRLHIISILNNLSAQNYIDYICMPNSIKKLLMFK